MEETGCHFFAPATFFSNCDLPAAVGQAVVGQYDKIAAGEEGETRPESAVGLGLNFCVFCKEKQHAFLLLSTSASLYLQKPIQKRNPTS